MNAARAQPLIFPFALLSSSRFLGRYFISQFILFTLLQSYFFQSNFLQLNKSVWFLSRSYFFLLSYFSDQGLSVSRLDPVSVEGSLLFSPNPFVPALHTYRSMYEDGPISVAGFSVHALLTQCLFSTNGLLSKMKTDIENLAAVH